MMHRMIFYVAVMALLACLPAGVMSSLTLVPPTPTTCAPIILPTGEKYYPVVLAQPLPDEITPGETYSVRLTGGVLVPQAALNCGGTHPTLLPFLPGTPEASMRLVELRLDDTLLYSQICAYDCALEFTVPADVAPGRATFRLNVIFTRDTYPVNVLPGER
jgi:hypothetical protein